MFIRPTCCQEEKRGITVRRQISTSSLWHYKHVLEHIRNGRQKMKAELLFSWAQVLYTFVTTSTNLVLLSIVVESNGHL